MENLTIRALEPRDSAEIVEVFNRAVLEGAVSAYSNKERAAWVNVPAECLVARVLSQHTYGAVAQGRLVGFMTRDGDVLDFAYVAPEVQGQGVAYWLYQALVRDARMAGVSCLKTEASLVAQPFFLRQGWVLEAQQQVERNGVVLRNARMSGQI